MGLEQQLLGNSETIGLQQQVARLQALLEATRQVHSTIQEKEVLEQVLRIVVRELEMAGAAFPAPASATVNSHTATIYLHGHCRTATASQWQSW